MVKIPKKAGAEAEVVGFKSHPVHFFLLYNYGIGLSSFSVIVGQIQQHRKRKQGVKEEPQVATLLIRANENAWIEEHSSSIPIDSLLFYPIITRHIHSLFLKNKHNRSK